MAIVHVTKENFEEQVMQAQNKVLVDFWAVWCGPCQMIAPVLEELAREHEELTVAKVDVDEAPDIAREFGIHSIPTLILMDRGTPVQKLVGFRPKEDIEKYL